MQCIVSDSIYTERYLGLPTPEDNLQGYNDSDVTRLVEGFRGKQFYLLHGNADDNVHYLQAMELSRALELSDILFRQQVCVW
jgi:dipeptidyl-peptidase-4